ncbi:MAG: ABC transporter [Firmicutes bacterium HGW-Firmicutes-2]|jgi:zinc transport system permease protein|nr:MAG: ABC transporter [Firmicutes bacterium HGW-Firmicutes-2]
MSEQLAYYLSFPFVRYAIIVGVLVALSSSLLGVVLVLKRFSYIGSGLSHVAFGTYAIAMILGFMNDMILVMPLTVIIAILLLRSKQINIKGDASIAMVSISALAIGYFLMNVFSESANISADVCSTLFGSTSILTLTKVDVIMSIVMAISVILVFVFFYHRIFSITFDEEYANASGIKVNGFNTAFSIITAVVIVLAMNLVGSLLITGLIIFPALTAMRLFHSFLRVVIATTIISVVGAFLGMLMAILVSSPVGSTIVIMYLLFFFIGYFISKFGGE